MKGFTGAQCNGELVRVSGTLTFKSLGGWELAVATGEGSRNRQSRFTIRYLHI